MSTHERQAPQTDRKRISVGDELTDIVWRGQTVMSTRDPTRAQRFRVTAIHDRGIDLEPIHDDHSRP